jgi:epoxyqueuosine reductase
MKAIAFADLKTCAEGAGFQLVAVVAARSLEHELERLRVWQGAGYAGEMSYMQREAELLTSPERLFEPLKSIVVIGAHYDCGVREPFKLGYGRVARYAWGRDYHKVIRRRLKVFVEQVERVLGLPVAHRLFSDSVPLLERALARDAGLGFIGKNTMVITPRLGSFMFLGEVLWELEVYDLPASVVPQSVSEGSVNQAAKGSCGTCSRCLDGCPTGAFVEEYVLDARRCISYLTIEKRGTLSVQERLWLGEWLFGCDVCQEVCPFNGIAIKKKRSPVVPEFESTAGVGQMLSLNEILSIRTEEQFVKRFAGTPLMRTKREGLVRNAAVVAANTHAEMTLRALEDAIRCDESPIVRRHALWSHWEISARLGEAAHDQSAMILESCRRDADDGVQDEVLACLTGSR